MNFVASCSICGEPCGPAIYLSGERSLTSLSRIVSEKTAVYACPECGHSQSAAFTDTTHFYASEYDILVESEDEDQIYEMRNGVARFRTQHQVETLINKLQLEDPIKLLDYGCAKSSTIRKLCESRPWIVPYLFDVSSRYQPFWRRFAPPENCAVHALPESWTGRFDVVTSFFSLEHIHDPVQSLSRIGQLLKPGGQFYGIVPNIKANIADLIVIDHCNHFTEPSLTRLVTMAGLELIEIDAQSHQGAFVVLARKPLFPGMTRPVVEDIPATLSALHAAAEFWGTAADRVRAYEAGLPPDVPVAIYGAGFYGAFIAANLSEPRRVVCHLDQNPFLVGREVDGRPILNPARLPLDIGHILVGLNPASARKIISEITAFTARAIDFFFL